MNLYRNENHTGVMYTVNTPFRQKSSSSQGCLTNVLGDPGAVTPGFHERGANSDRYDFVYMRLVLKSDWHEVFK